MLGQRGCRTFALGWCFSSSQKFSNIFTKKGSRFSVDIHSEYCLVNPKEFRGFRNVDTADHLCLLWKLSLRKIPYSSGIVLTNFWWFHGNLRRRKDRDYDCWLSVISLWAFFSSEYAFHSKLSCSGFSRTKVGIGTWARWKEENMLKCLEFIQGARRTRNVVVATWVTCSKRLGK